MSAAYVHPEDLSTTELQAEYERLLHAQEKLRGELEAVLGPDPEGTGLWERRQAEVNRVRGVLRPMNAFVGGAVAPWGQGEQRLHLYALPETSGARGGELLDELIRQGPVLDAHTGRVTAVPAEWLHITIGHVAGATEGEAERLAQALERGLALRGERGQNMSGTVPMAPVVTEHGVLLDEDGPGWEGALAPVSSLWRSATGARGAALEGAGAGRVRSSQSMHLTTAYCRAAGPGRALADRIGRPGPTVAVRVRELALVWVSQDPVAPAYTWRTVASWPVPAARSGSGY